MRIGLTFLLMLGCGPAQPTHEPPASLVGCTQEGLAPASSIASLVERVNQLAPSEPACLLASLPRPLQVVATTSITSAQPATGRSSPRFFLVGTDVALSFVPDGDGAHLVEFGQWLSPTRTLKGELELPRQKTLPLDAAFSRVRFGTGTTCGLCHREELPDDSRVGAFTSLAFRPVSSSLVPLTELATSHEQCTKDDDRSSRCELFHALFDFGATRQGAFAAEVALFAGP